MNEIIKNLYMSTWLLHVNKANSGLDYLSRIDGEPASWYLWLTGTSGVYEIKLKEEASENALEKSKFYLKYYPAVDEPLFEAYSCCEQLLRLSEFFEQENVTISESEEICPCCGGKDEHCHDHRHNQLVKRPKGIPSLSKRKMLDDSLFTVGELSFEIDLAAEKLKSCGLITQKLYETRADSGIYLKDANGVEQEAVAPGGVDRSLPGLEISKIIYSFIKDKMLKVLGYESCGEERSEKGNVVQINTALKFIKK